MTVPCPNNKRELKQHGKYREEQITNHERIKQLVIAQSECHFTAVQNGTGKRTEPYIF